jgi:hypothetical protein
MIQMKILLLKAKHPGSGAITEWAGQATCNPQMQVEWVNRVNLGLFTYEVREGRTVASAW